MFVRDITSKEVTALNEEVKKRNLKLGWKIRSKFGFIRIPVDEEFNAPKIIQEITDNLERIKLYRDAKYNPTHICTACSHAEYKMNVRCTQCKNKQVIPIDTPKGKELFATLEDKPYLEQPSFKDKFQTFVGVCIFILILALIAQALDDDSSPSYSSSRSMTHAEHVENGFYVGLRNSTGTQFEKDSFKCVGAMSVFDAYKTEGNYSKKEEWKRKSTQFCKGVVY